MASFSDIHWLDLWLKGITAADHQGFVSPVVHNCSVYKCLLQNSISLLLNNIWKKIACYICLPFSFHWSSVSLCTKKHLLFTHTTPAPHHSIFYRPDALPAAKPTAWKHWRQKLSTFRSLTLTLTSTLTGSVSCSTIVNSDINVHVSSSRFCFFVNFHSFIIRASFLVLGSCVHFVFLWLAWMVVSLHLIAWKESLWNDLFCVKCDVEHYPLSHSFAACVSWRVSCCVLVVSSL